MKPQDHSIAEAGELTVAILSDTHAWLHPGVADTVARSDLAVHAGDICTAAVLEALRPRLARVIAVAGNNDRPPLWPAAEAPIAATLPQAARIRLPGGVLAVEHGESHGFHHPDHESLRRAHPEARLIVYGHTHRRVIDAASRPWVANPGAAGRTRTHGGPSCLVLTASEHGWRLQSRVFEPAD